MMCVVLVLIPQTLDRCRAGPPFVQHANVGRRCEMLLTALCTCTQSELLQVTAALCFAFRNKN